MLYEADLTNEPLMSLLRFDGLLTDAPCSISMMTMEKPQCRYLEDGRCSIYDIRPVSCRAFHCLASDSGTHSQGPFHNGFEPWIRHVKACGYTFNHSGTIRTAGGRSPRKRLAKELHAPYGYRCDIVRRGVGLLYFRYVYELDGVRHTVFEPVSVNPTPRLPQALAKQAAQDAKDLLWGSRPAYYDWLCRRQMAAIRCSTAQMDKACAP